MQDIVKDILEIVIKDGKGIEINTGSLYKGFSYPHPHESILKWYRQLGGEIVTVGSDAHTPQYLGHGFRQAAALLQSCGFRYYTIFSEGKPQYIAL